MFHYERSHMKIDLAVATQTHRTHRRNTLLETKYPHALKMDKLTKKCINQWLEHRKMQYPFFLRYNCVLLWYNWTVGVWVWLGCFPGLLTQQTCGYCDDYQSSLPNGNWTLCTLGDQPSIAPVVCRRTVTGRMPVDGKAFFAISIHTQPQSTQQKKGSPESQYAANAQEEGSCCFPKFHTHTGPLNPSQAVTTTLQMRAPQLHSYRVAWW